MVALVAVATIHAQSSGTYTGYNFTANGTATGFGGATTASALTDLKLTKTSTSVATIAAGTYAKGNAPAINYAGGTVTIGSLTISGCTNASPIVCTVSSMSGKSPRTGDTVTISGVGGNTAANGTFVIERLSDTTIALNGTTGNGSYTSGGTVAGAGSGTCVFYMTPQGYLTVDCPTSAALILSCTGNCTMNQSASPAPAGDGTYVGDMTVTTGAWDTATVQRALINAGWDVQAGTGIAVANAGGTATVGVDSTVARTSGTNTFTGANSFTAATRTAPHRSGTGSPASRDNCTVGDTYFQTDATAGSNIWGCTSTNTWTLQGGGSGKGYTLHIASIGSTSPSDGTTYYVGRQYGGSTGLLGTGDTGFIAAGYAMAPVAGTLTVASILANYAEGAAGSNENVTYSVCVNNTSTCTSLGTATWDASYGRYSNITGLSIAVSAGDKLILKIVTPTWATNPTNVRIAGDFYVQ